MGDLAQQQRDLQAAWREGYAAAEQARAAVTPDREAAVPWAEMTADQRYGEAIDGMGLDVPVVIEVVDRLHAKGWCSPAEVAQQVADAEQRGAENAAKRIEVYRDERPRRDRLGRFREAAGGYVDMRAWLNEAARLARGDQQP